MKAPSVVFFPGMVRSVPILQLHMRLAAGHKAGAAASFQRDVGMRRGTGVLDFSTLGSLLVLTVCELDILCNNAVLKSALFMRAV